MTLEAAHTPHGLVPLLAITAGGAMASNYLLQPLLPDVVRSFPHSLWIAGAAAGAAPIGYVAGLLLLVPLADSVRIRPLIVGQALVLALAMATAGIAHDPVTLVLSLVIGGAAATVTAQCIALAGRVFVGRQGRAVGTLVMGVSIGILAGRLLSGTIGDALGWRAPFGFMALLSAIGAGFLYATLPDRQAKVERRSLTAHLMAIPIILTEDSGVRRSVLIGGCWFAAFSLFWATLAFHLARPPLGYGSAVAGSFGLIGIVGAVVARLAGQGSDRWGARTMIFAGLAAAFAGFVLLAARPLSIFALAGGALLMDAGCFGANAAMQAHILGMGGPEPNSRYGAYMTAYWTAGAVGALVGPSLFFALGWSASMLVCALIIIIAAILNAMTSVAGPTPRVVSPTSGG